MTINITEMAPHRRSMIAFLMQGPFTRREGARYGVTGLKAAGIDVVVIDTAAIANPGGHFPPIDPRALPGVEVHVCATFSDLPRLQPVLDRTALVVCDVGSGNVDSHTLPLLRWLSRSGRPYVILSVAAIPTADRLLQPVSVWARLRKASLVRSCLSRSPLWLLGLRHADYVIYGGSRSCHRMRLVDKRTAVFWSQTFDQDAADDELAARPFAPVTDTAVFLDQYFGFHPGAFVRGFGHAVNPEYFYPRLRRLFDRIEGELGLKIVIAAHPRADYRDKPDLFGPRPIHYGDTARLIRECRLAISSYSTSINFAVLYNKPILIYTLPSIVRLSYVHNAPGAVAQALARKVDDLSEPDAISLDGLLDVDRDAYRQYREYYIKSDRANGQRCSDILLELCRRHGGLPQARSPNRMEAQSSVFH